MRKPLLVAVASVVFLAACGDDTGGSDSNTTTAATTGTETTVAGETTVPAPTVPPTTPRPTLPKPAVAIPATAPTELVITDLKVGTGEGAADGDQVVVHYVGVRTRDGVEFDSNYDGDPYPVNLGVGEVIKGWDLGLVGVKTGGQRRLDIPSALAYGADPKGAVIGANENLTFVIDVVAVIKKVDPTKEPTLIISPSTTPATAVSFIELVEGDGATAEVGANVTFSYIFYRGDTGQKVFSSWAEAPAGIPLVKDGNIDGIIEGLTGMKVGGRRQITIPSATVFAGEGNDSLGLPPGIDLIMVADLLATY